MTAPAFRRLVDPTSLPDEFGRPVVAIGNFDGVHRGHQIVLQAAIDEAQRRGVHAIALTFEPHPRTLFAPEKPVYRLSPAPVRALVLQALGMASVVELGFDQDFASRSASSFIENILLTQLRACHVVTGYDFHFGKGREGSPEFLLSAGREHGFGVTVVEAQKDEAGDVVSSSRIRTLLGEGELPAAAGLLGYRPQVESEIVTGAQLGRTLGYPTANMALPAETGLRHGIYAVRFFDGSGMQFEGVASYGRRPTVNTGDPLLETFVFDFEGNLYGQVCRVALFAYLRPEAKFDGVEELVAQMHIDADQARQMMLHAQPLTPLDARLNFELGHE